MPADIPLAPVPCSPWNTPICVRRKRMSSNSQSIDWLCAKPRCPACCGCGCHSHSHYCHFTASGSNSTEQLPSKSTSSIEKRHVAWQCRMTVGLPNKPINPARCKPKETITWQTHPVWGHAHRRRAATTARAWTRRCGSRPIWKSISNIVRSSDYYSERHRASRSRKKQLAGVWGKVFLCSKLWINDPQSPIRRHIPLSRLSPPE